MKQGGMKFFAEALTRLGILHLEIEVDTRAAGPRRLTRLSINEDVSHAELRHNNDTQIIPLPAATTIEFVSSFPLTQSIITFHDHVSSGGEKEPTPLVTAEDVSKLWMGGGKLACASCHKPIVEHRGMKWEDMSSESLREYADYWLCYRTSYFRSQTPPIVLKATPGTVLVGLTFFIVHSDDTQNLQIKVLPLRIPCYSDLKKAYLCLNHRDVPIQNS